ncbi:hypothetical protein IE53DRAFT_367676 [Violaceomyces palustris]|uniref:Uncharacterized protein n=1 Tax=Violaceomyces palustris TaxID=1673888 RepID=A0ACD0P1H1_9BASI|nr:hypothetical protein IE53DRAFT_367676 [Violaceomyces palustris]
MPPHTTTKRTAEGESRPPTSDSSSSLILWKPSLDIDLDVWLDMNKPSLTPSSPGGDGWIWVTTERKPGRNHVLGELDDWNTAVELVDLAVKERETINNDPTIPLRASRAKGASKKQRRMEIEGKLRSDLAELGNKRAGWRSGKWMLFVSPSYVDYVFAKLAKSVFEGSLSQLRKARCYTIKAATKDAAERGDDSHGSSFMRNDGSGTYLICVYFENVWNKEHATEVLRCLIESDGERPTACKPDLYTLLGINSKHESGLRSTIYQPKELFTLDEVEEMNSRWRRKTETGTGGAKIVVRTAATKSQRMEDEDGFLSPGGEEGSKRGSGRARAGAKITSPTDKGSDSQDEERAKSYHGKLNEVALKGMSEQKQALREGDVSNPEVIQSVKRDFPTSLKEKPHKTLSKESGLDEKNQGKMDDSESDDDDDEVVLKLKSSSPAKRRNLPGSCPAPPVDRKSKRDLWGRERSALGEVKNLTEMSAISDDDGGDTLDGSWEWKKEKQGQDDKFPFPHFTDKEEARASTTAKRIELDEGSRGSARKGSVGDEATVVPGNKRRVLPF